MSQLILQFAGQAMNAIKKKKLEELAACLREEDFSQVKAVVGFDGFVDEIVHVVDKRIDDDNFERLNFIVDFGERIKRSANLSTNFEMVTVQQKLGGNGPILSNALIEYGAQLTYIGALGVPDVHPVFLDMVSRSKAYSLTNPGNTDAIEFHDGKIISSKLSSLSEINWEAIIRQVGLEPFIDLLDQAQIIGFENWTMVPHMNEIWERIQKEVMPRLRQRDPKPMLFIDLADPEKRETEDIRQALELLGGFSEKFDVYFGLNKKEACEIAEVLGMRVGSFELEELKPLAEFIFDHMRVACVMVHPLKEACAVTKEGYFHVEGPYCEKPLLTTGAGDNMNAGFVLGVTLGLGLDYALLLGKATSGYYVRERKSPQKHEIIDFIEKWAADAIE